MAPVSLERKPLLRYVALLLLLSLQQWQPSDAWISSPSPSCSIPTAAGASSSRCRSTRSTVPGTTTASPLLSLLTRTTIGLKAVADSGGDDKDEEDNEEDRSDLEGSLDRIEDEDELIRLELGKIIVDSSTSSSTTTKKKLGIDIGSQLAPLTNQQAAELKAAAMEVINDGVAEGIDEIEKLRQTLKQEVAKQQAQNALRSDLQLQKESSKLMNKIDRMTNTFLDDTKAARDQTKWVAKADATNRDSGVGTEVGVWGMIGGAAVVTEGRSSLQIGLLGSVDAAKQAAQKEVDKANQKDMSDLKKSAGGSSSPVFFEEETSQEINKNRVVIVADVSQDPMAKALVPAFAKKLQSAIPTLEEIIILKPTDTIPLGGNNAVCAIVFCTSLTDRTAVLRIMERLLRRTMQPGGGGALGSPPTQFIGVSSIGTERTDKFPYSLQNLMGGKLDQRRQMEEAMIGMVQDRQTSSPPLDYTLCKFGDIVADDKAKDDFRIMPGDVLDGTTSLETATNVLLQAIAYQPYARNATLSAIGRFPQSTTRPSSSDDDIDDDDEALNAILDDAFLRLDGPERQRWTTPSSNLGGPAQYDQLCEYLNEWANNLALRPRGLTTPIQVAPSTKTTTPRTKKREGVQERSGVQLLFLPTATGTNYLSREEEQERESEGRSGQVGSSSSSSGSRRSNNSRKEGGIEVVVEITVDNTLRIRAKRCNYADGVALKELSEETILKRLESAIDVWSKETKK